MYLFFDTETTGLPRNYKAPVSDVNNWPRMVQLAWLLYDGKGKLVSGKNHIIKPEGFTIPVDATKVHGISTKRAIEEGVFIQDVLNEFHEQISLAKCLVAHNISFDEKIAGAEFIRNKMSNPIASKARICTMEVSTDYCKLEGQYGYKWPKLAELHYKLFNTHFEEAHNAAVDITATAKCFWELKERGVIKG